MRNRAGIEIAAYPAHAADRVDNAVSIQAAHRRIAVFIQKLRRAVGTNFMRMLAAEGAVYRPAIGQVIFCLRHAELAFNIAIAPLLAVVFAVVRQRRNEIHAADIDAHRTAVERFLLIAEIERGAETVAAVIKPQRSQRGTAFIIIDSAFTLAVHQLTRAPNWLLSPKRRPSRGCRPPENQRYSRRQRVRSADLPPASARG